jgi:uncharacterized protein (DUF1330 family)
MAAYAVFIREEEVRDPAEMATYAATARGAGGDFKLTSLVTYGAIEALEGAPADGMVILQFPTVEDAKAWYNSPGYQKALPHRMKAADYRVMIVQGV